MNIYVGNLPFDTTEDELKAHFGAFGEVTTAKVIIDRATGRSRGFGFVEMPDGEAQTAITELNGKPFKGRSLRVNESKPREGGGAGPRAGGMRRQHRN